MCSFKTIVARLQTKTSEFEKLTIEMFAIFHGCNLGINLLSQQSYLVKAEIPHCIDKEMPQKA